MLDFAETMNWEQCWGDQDRATPISERICLYGILGAYFACEGTVYATRKIKHYYNKGLEKLTSRDN